MKITRFLPQIVKLILVSCLFSSFTSSVDECLSQKNVEQTISNDAVLGVWKYRMTNIDAPYEKGMFFITEKDGSFDVAVKLSTGMLTGQDVTVSEKGINFNVNFEGLKRVSFVLLVSGDKIMGESYSSIGTSEILGIRQLPGR